MYFHHYVVPTLQYTFPLECTSRYSVLTPYNILPRYNILPPYNILLSIIFLSTKFKRISNSFVKNSDHSDMNRWLKRGWGLVEPLRLIKLPKISDTKIDTSL